jgi:hypothetical protein
MILWPFFIQNYLLRTFFLYFLPSRRVPTLSTVRYKSAHIMLEFILILRKYSPVAATRLGQTLQLLDQRPLR